MITFVSHLNVEDEFQKLIPGLSRAELKTSLGRFWDLPSLKDSILNKKTFAFHQISSGYSGAFYIGKAPLCKTLYIFWAGKDLSSKEQIDYHELESFFDYMANLFGCKFVSCEGRKGWKPILSPFGYVEESVVYTKEVSYELPQL